MSNCTTHTCPTCESTKPNRFLKKLGIKLDKWDYIVALAGNPNTGKSTVFNYLTGLRQHTGNWPGKTVSRAEGGFSYQEKNYKIVDLPGTYSLLSASPDEEVARDFILFAQPDATLIIADANCLERNLNLTMQILQITQRAILCVNLMDEARAQGISVDARTLSRDLGIPVVLTSARQGEGMDALLTALAGVVSGETPLAKQRRPLPLPSKETQSAIEEIANLLLASYPDLPAPEWVALRLLNGDPTIMEALRSGSLGHLHLMRQFNNVTETKSI